MNKGLIIAMVALFFLFMGVAFLSFNLGIKQERQFCDWKSNQYDSLVNNIYNNYKHAQSSNSMGITTNITMNLTGANLS